MKNSAKRYSSIKYGLAIFDTLYLFVLLLVFMGSGISLLLAREVSGVITAVPLAIAAYFLIVYVAYYLLDLPVNFYQSFVLEHRFSLCSQKLKDWFVDQAKTVTISCIIGLILIEVFYYIVKILPHTWWVAVSLFWIFFSLIFAKLMPVLIIPLFFKYKKLSDENLRERIVSLADKIKIKILDVFEIDFSKKTLKANAALVGWGATKRVILADTLKDKYTNDEIEVILAHEFAHYKLRHLLKLILVSSIGTIAAFYLIFLTSNKFLALYGLSSLSDIAGFPVVVMYMVLFALATQPLQNYISRVMERNADILAVKTTGAKEAFSSMMGKLALQNLADRNPHPVIKFLFFDHPPIDERIACVKNL